MTIYSVDGADLNLYLKDGLVQPLEKTRGRTKAIDRLMYIAGKRTGNQKTIYSLIHGMDPAGMEQSSRVIVPRLNYDQPVYSTAGAVIGTHTGPGALGFTFIPKEFK